MNLPQVAFNIIVEMREKYDKLAVGGDVERRQLTYKIAQTICARLGPLWGTKSQSSHHPQSKDSIAYLKTTRSMDIWDWQNGTDRSVQVYPSSPPTYPDVAGQFFIKVFPLDWLRSGLPLPTDSPSTPSPTTPSPRDDDDAEKIAWEVFNDKMMDELRKVIATTRADCARIEAGVKLLLGHAIGQQEKLDVIKARQNDPLKSSGWPTIVLRRVDKDEG